MDKFEINGMEALQKGLKKNMDLTPIKQAVKANGAEMHQKAMRNAPADTGFMKRSITIDIQNDGMEAHVYPTAEYAPYLEYGTRFMSAQPFMRPSFNEQVNRFRSDLQKLMR